MLRGMWHANSNFPGSYINIQVLWLTLLSLRLILHINCRNTDIHAADSEMLYKIKQSLGGA